MEKSYCIFGDSVTQASYVKVNWVNLLQQYLENKHTQDFVNVFNLGISGNTTEDILKRLVNESKLRFPTSIIFAVGVNDSVLITPSEFKTNLLRLIDLATQFTSDITFIGLVLGNWQGIEPYTPEKTFKYNQIIKETAELNQCKFIQLQEKLTPADFIDGLHPNDQGHSKMFAVIKEYF